MSDEKKKYELLRDFRKPNNSPYSGWYYRIRATRDFGNVKEGQLGGWIESERNLSHDGNAWVADEARVAGTSKVEGDALIADNALVSHSSLVKGKAVVSGEAVVLDSIVDEHAIVTDQARVTYGSEVKGDAVVKGCAAVSLAVISSGTMTEGAIMDTDKLRLFSYPASRRPGIWPD